jgi:hypothetical protein
MTQGIFHALRRFFLAVLVFVGLRHRRPSVAFTVPGLDKHPKEAAIIGRLLAGYGELEFALGLCVTAVIGDIDVMVKVLFRSRGEEARISIADALVRHKFVGTPLYEPYQQAISDMQHCKTIRNQYAHCHFDGQDTDVLRFVDLEKTAKSTTDTVVKRTPLGLDVLQAQEEFFGFVEWRLFWLSAEYDKAAGKTPIRTVTKPPAIEQSSAETSDPDARSIT